MTKKDFELIAATIWAELNNAATRSDPKGALAAHDTCGNLAQRFAARFAEGNPRFDRACFLKACGVEGEG